MQKIFSYVLFAHLIISLNNDPIRIKIKIENKIKIFYRIFISWFKEFSQLHTQILPFINENKGKLVLEDYLKLAQEKYPWYVDEMRGISIGSQVEFELVIFINFFLIF